MNRYIFFIALFLASKFVKSQDQLRFRILPEKPVINAVKDFTGLFQEPFTDKRKSLLTIAGVGLGTFALYQLDDDIQNWFQANKNEIFDQLSYNVFSPIGSEYSVAIIGATVLGGIVTNNDRVLETGYLAAEAFLYSGLISRVPKVTFGRQRPNAGLEPDKSIFKGPSLGVERGDRLEEWKSERNLSYVSGHATLAFAVATVFSEQSIKYGDKKWVPYVCYGLASLSAFSRVYDNEHWATDVLGGAILGHLIAKYLVRNHHWKLKPYKFANSEGLSISRTF